MESYCNMYTKYYSPIKDTTSRYDELISLKTRRSQTRVLRQEFSDVHSFRLCHCHGYIPSSGSRKSIHEFISVVILKSSDESVILE